MRLRVSVPLLVDGSIGSTRVHIVLGGAAHGMRAGFPTGRVDLTVRPLLPLELLSVRKGASGRALLQQATLASLEFARTRQYDAFLGNPDPIARSSTTYVFRSAARAAPVATPVPKEARRDWPRAVLIGLGVLALLAGATVAWSRA
jgi:hypothetical protein